MLFSMDGNYIEYLDDANFRSNDCINLLKEADIVAMNPHSVYSVSLLIH